MVEITVGKDIPTEGGEMSVTGFADGRFMLTIRSPGRYLRMDCHLNCDELTRLGAAITDVLNAEVL